MRRKNILFAIMLTTLLISGCGRQQNQMKYIGAETAKQAALNASGLSNAETESLIADLSSKKGTDYYQVTFTAAGQNYRYDIDALTGVVIDSQISPIASEESQSASTDSADSVQSDETVQAGTPSAAKSQIPADSQPADDLQTSADSQPADSSQVSADSSSDSNAGAGAGNGMLTADDAKSCALAHAGLTSDQVTFKKTRQDYENGRQVYDVEFYTADRKEYDYEIDAYTGEIISYDYEAKNLPSSDDNSTISEEEAKKLALAQVPGAADSDIRKFKTDYDDGRMEYDGTIIYDGMKYEFEIDAYSGAIRSWESEPAGH